jgi:hypothetical protein
MSLQMFDNPVICRIKSVFYNHKLNPWVSRYPHPGIGHQSDSKALPVSNAEYLLFYRTGISIHKDI